MTLKLRPHQSRSKPDWGRHGDSSKQQFQCELDISSKVISRAPDHTKSGGAKNVIWHAEIRVVENVEHFGPELQGHTFARLEFLERREVHTDCSGASHGVTAQIADCERRVQYECCFVEPIVDGTRTVTKASAAVGESGCIWTIGRLAGVRQIGGGLD